MKILKLFDLKSKEGVKNVISLFLWAMTLIMLVVFVAIAASFSSNITDSRANILAAIALVLCLFLVAALLFTVFDKLIVKRKAGK